MKSKSILDMEAKISGDFDNVSDEGSTASLDTSSSSSSSVAIDLPPEWEVALADDKGRLYYTEHDKKVTNWCPPIKSWKCCFGMPFGWEVAIDDNHFLYYINHRLAVTTYKHPNYENKQFEALHQALQAKRRKVVIKRHAQDGFGFVAGSEKPVIIRSVVADLLKDLIKVAEGSAIDKLFKDQKFLWQPLSLLGSPADGQLSANDQLFTINGQIAYNLPQPQVISMIRSCTDVLEMEVIATEDIQDVRNQGTLKSALMSRATRERRKSCPVSVRFEEKPEVVSLSAPNILSINIIKQMIPNVLKIYLENGQTKSFQYNTETTVKEIFDSLIQRLQIKESKHFALILIGPYPNQSTFLQPEDRVTQIINKKVYSRWECRLELSFIPNDAFELLGQDPIAFDYWYQQTCDSVVKGHFGSDLKFDAVMRLAALQIHVAMTTENEDTKFTLKDVAKEYGGLDCFLPNGIISSFKKKDIKKALMAQLKSLSRIALPGQRLTPLQAKLHYLKIASQNPAFGGRILSAHIVDDRTGSDSSADTALDTCDILVSSYKGIWTLFSETGNLLQHLVDITSITGMVVTSHMMNKHLLKLFVKDRKAISFILSPQDADDMAFIICKYHRIHLGTASDLPFYNLSQTIPRYRAPGDSKAPKYDGEHHVVPSTWSYIDDVVPTLWLGNNLVGDPMKSITVDADFSTGPPKYNSQTSYDRSSFVPYKQRPAVDSLIRELSIRDKKRNNLKKAVETAPKPKSCLKQRVSSPGQFDTTHFGQGSALVEEDDTSQGTSDAGSPTVSRHIITCSMSSDEGSSDEEVSDLARKVNRAGTVVKFLKNKNKSRDKLGSNCSTDETTALSPGDEEDSGWRTDTSSNTGSLGRSNPWGTFSEEDDSSEKDSLRQLTDTESIISQKDEPLDLAELASVEESRAVEEFRTGHHAEMLHQNLIISSVAKEENLPMASTSNDNLMKSNSFSKYLVKKLPSNVDTEHSVFDELLSDSDERPSPLQRPLSEETSDDVFTGDEPVFKEKTASERSVNKSRKGFTVSDKGDEPRIAATELSNTKLSQSSPPPVRAGTVSPYSDSSSTSSLILEDKGQFQSIKVDEPLDIDERPKSVNLTDLNIYIPGPPKERTRALSPSELVIPSPPLEFSDNQEENFSYQFINVEDNESSTESSNNGTLSSSSSSSDVIEFMVNGVVGSSAQKNSSPVDGGRTLDNEVSNDDEVVEFMKREDNQTALLNEEADSGLLQNHIDERAGLSEQNDSNEDKPLTVFLARKTPSYKNSTSFNENDKIHHGLSVLPGSEIRDENARRQSEPVIPSLTLPRSPGLDLKKERIMSPLFFSAESESSSPKTYHFRSHSDNESNHFHFESPRAVNKTSTENQPLTLPSTPLAVRRSMFHSLCSVDNASKSKSLPNDFTYDEFNEYLDACKAAIVKSLQLADELNSLVGEKKCLTEQGIEDEEHDRQSYVDVIRSCGKSLSNKTKELVSLSTSGNIRALHRFLRSSQNEIERMVVAVTTLENSTTIANLIKDVVLEYTEVVKCLKKSTGKPLTDPDVVNLIEKINELTFSSTILLRGLRPN